MIKKGLITIIFIVTSVILSNTCLLAFVPEAGGPKEPTGSGYAGLVTQAKDTLSQANVKETPVFVPGGSVSPETFQHFKDENTVWSTIPGFVSFITFFEHLSLGYRLLLFLGLFAFFFLLNIVFVLLVVTISNHNINRKKRRYNNTREYVIEILSPLLYDSDNEIRQDQETAKQALKKLKTNKEKQVIIDVLMEARRNLTGNSINLLLEFYEHLKLYKLSESSIASFRWYAKAQGLREISYLGERLKRDDSLLKKYLNSRNHKLRLEAILAFILVKDEPLGVLDYLNKPFSRWIQLSAYYTMYANSVEPPLLGNNLEHNNPQVVMWCLRLIAIYNQVETSNKVTRCLIHKSEQVRKVAVQASVAIENWRVKGLLKKRYFNESIHVKIEILNLISHFSDSGDTQFLLAVIRSGEFIEVLKAAGILYQLDGDARNVLYAIDEKQDKQLALIIKHVAEPLNKVAV